MLRAVKESVRHVRIALVDGVEVGVTELRRPMFIKAVVDLGFDARDLCLADVLEAVDHIGRYEPLDII